MKKISKKIRILLLALILFAISAVWIIANGRTYTIEIRNTDNIRDIQQINVIIENENIAKCIDKSIEEDVIKIKLESISKGKTFIDIKKDEGTLSHLSSIYVHNFGIITFNEFLGTCKGGIIIPISIFIFLAYILYLLVLEFIKSIKENIYQYKNIVYLSNIILLGYGTISQLKNINHNFSLIQQIDSIQNLFSFAIILLPVTFVVSILVIISNISLIRKEGFCLKNLLGIILGAFLCFSTILPELTYKMTYLQAFINVHNQNGIEMYIYQFIETMVYVITTYIECILIGTIIISFKSARHIPNFDKDYIIILGCKIKKDGTLTNLLKGRVDKAIEFSKMQKNETGKDIIFVPSGGKGTDEIISEAEAMKKYLIQQGIQEENILVEDKSQNTFENIKFSNKLITEKCPNAKIAFSTTNYHVFRAGNIANSQNLYFEGIGAKTKPYFWVNAFIREFVATLHSERKKHIIAFLSIMLVMTATIVLSYINNNI